MASKQNLMSREFSLKFESSREFATYSAPQLRQADTPPTPYLKVSHKLKISVLTHKRTQGLFFEPSHCRLSSSTTTKLTKNNKQQNEDNRLKQFYLFLYKKMNEGKLSSVIRQNNRTRNDIHHKKNSWKHQV
jgi:hypothetical protein